MEGIYFYWIFWIGWVYTTFLFDKTKQRISITIGILLFIIFSNKHIVVGDVVLNSTILLCLAIGYFLVSKKAFGTVLYYLSIGLILTSSYVAFRLFQLYDPVWVMFHPTFKLSIILILLVIILVKEQSIRIAILFIAVSQGELIYFLFLNRIFPQEVIGKLESLDIIAITTALSYLWFAFEKMVAMLDDYVKQRITLSTSKR